MVSHIEPSGLPPIYQSSLLALPHGFSTKLGGVSEGIYQSLNLGHSRGDNPMHVEENFRRFCRSTGCDFDGMVFTRQVHGARVRRVGRADANHPLTSGVDEDCDGLMTQERGVALVIFSADCIPVLLYDAVRGVIAAVHAGWRGTALRIPAVAVAQMAAEYGSQPSDICAAIGPGIGACCFETDADVPEAMPWARENIAVLPKGKYRVDLKAINALALTQAGVPLAQIDLCDACTKCEQAEFWSHRREQSARGSLASIIQLP